MGKGSATKGDLLNLGTVKSPVLRKRRGHDGMYGKIIPEIFKEQVYLRHYRLGGGF